MGLSRQLLLDLAQELRIVGSDGWILRAILRFVPGCGDNFFLMLGNLFGGIAAAPAAFLLRLGIVALERFGLDKVHVGLGSTAGVARGSINAHQVARGKLVIFKRYDVFALGVLGSFLGEHRNSFFRTTVHGIVQADFVQSEIVLGADRHGDFFNRIHLGIPSGTNDFDAGRRIFAGFDKEILAHADVLALFDGRDVIHAVLLDREMGGKPVPRPGLECNLRVVAQHQDALVEWTIGLDRDLGIGTFHRAHISAGIFHYVLQAGPGRVMIRDADLLDGRQVDHAQVEMLGLDGAGFDVILDIFRQTAEQEFKGRCARRRPHFDRFPLRGALRLSEQAYLRSIEANELGRHQLIGLAAHGAVAGVDRDVVKGMIAASWRARP